mmetsp:Transcript_66468/g.138815  ORF Transcript_66468/g.138815 Transcript_66468/m.138815 type:complete len:162 (+) Transcript_66468:152-637(+)
MSGASGGPFQQRLPLSSWYQLEPFQTLASRYSLLDAGGRRRSQCCRASGQSSQMGSSTEKRSQIGTGKTFNSSCCVHNCQCKFNKGNKSKSNSSKNTGNGNENNHNSSNFSLISEVAEMANNPLSMLSSLLSCLLACPQRLNRSAARWPIHSPTCCCSLIA